MRTNKILCCLALVLFNSLSMTGLAQTPFPPIAHNLGVNENWWTWALTFGISDGYMVDDVTERYNIITSWNKSPGVPNNPLTDVALQDCTSSNSNFNTNTYPGQLQSGTTYCPPGSLQAWDEGSTSSSTKIATSLSFSTGFTLMVVAYVDPTRDPTSTTAMNYMSLLDSNYQPMLAVGRMGSRWGLARTDPQTNGSMGWHFPWDSQVGSQSFQIAFYTFTPDGKCRIDVFNTTPGAQDWEASLLDLGMPVASVNSGTPSTSPSTPTPLQPAWLSFGGLNSTKASLIPVAPGTGFLNLSAWNGSLTQGQIYYLGQRVMNNLNASSSSNVLPCNTGYMVAPGGKDPQSGTRYAPTGTYAYYVTPANLCNYTSNWTRSNPGQLTAKPGTLNLPYDTGSPSSNVPQTVTLTNTGGTALWLNNFQITGNPSFYSLSTSCTNWLYPNQSCGVTLSYGNGCPASAQGTISASVSDANGKSLPALALPWQTVSNATSCTPNPALSTSSLSFNDPDGQDGPTAVTLTNSGSGTFYLDSITITGTSAGSFTQSNNCNYGLAAGASCTINVTYLPTGNNYEYGTLNINNGTKPLSISLTGFSD